MPVRRSFPRRASLYITVLGASMLVSIIGLSAITTMRIQQKTAGFQLDAAEARWYARAGIETALAYTSQDPWWRGTLAAGFTLPSVSVGRGSVSITAVDEIDGLINNDSDDPLRITAVGTIPPNAQYAYSVIAEPPALTSLRPAIHASGTLMVNSAATLTVVGAPASGDTAVGVMGGTIVGDVESMQGVFNLGTITGTITKGGAPKEVPAQATVDYYKNGATPIPWSAISTNNKIQNTLISPAQSPGGVTNPDGLYYINAVNNLTLDNCRIEGTLVVEFSGPKALYITSGCSWQPFRADYPALIVIGNCQILINQDLTEAGTGTNFNPIGTPFGGVEDTDLLDVYPSLIRGLVHVYGGDLTMMNSTSIKGKVVVSGNVSINNTVTVTTDHNLLLSPPKRYRVSNLAVVPGTWQQATIP